MTSHFVLNSVKVGAIDKHQQKRDEEVKPDPIDVVSDAQKFYKSVHKVWDRIVHNSISVFNNTFTIHDMYARDEAEFALLVNYRKVEYDKHLKLAKKLYTKLLSK